MPNKRLELTLHVARAFSNDPKVVACKTTATFTGCGATNLVWPFDSSSFVSTFAYGSPHNLENLEEYHVNREEIELQTTETQVIRRLIEKLEHQIQKLGKTF